MPRLEGYPARWKHPARRSATGGGPPIGVVTRRPPLHNPSQRSRCERLSVKGGSANGHAQLSLSAGVGVPRSHWMNRFLIFGRSSAELFPRGRTRLGSTGSPSSRSIRRFSSKIVGLSLSSVLTSFTTPTPRPSRARDDRTVVI